MKQRKYLLIFILLLFIKSFCVSVSAEEKIFMPASFKQATDIMISSTEELILDTNSNITSTKTYKAEITKNFKKEEPEISRKQKKINRLKSKALDYISQNPAFNDIPIKINTSVYPVNDPNFEANQKAIMNRDNFAGDRYITVFSDGSYGVNKVKCFTEFYYNRFGTLISVQINSKLSLPRFASKYYFPSGRLIKIALQYKKDVDFVFDRDKELKAIWKGQKCFDLKGNVVVTRKSYKQPKLYKIVTALEKVNKILSFITGYKPCK